MQTVNELCNCPSETQQSPFSFRKLCFNAFGRRIDAMKQTVYRGRRVLACGKLVLEGVSCLEKNACRFDSKVIFKRCKRLRLQVDAGEDAELQNRSFEQVEASQRSLPSADAITRGHIACS